MILKKIKNIIFISIGISNHISELEASFKLPKEQEFEQAVQDYKKFHQTPDQTDEYVEQVKNNLLADSYLLNKQDKIMSLVDLAEYYSSQGSRDIAKDILDHQKAFEYLKSKMGVPEDVGIMYCFDQSLWNDVNMSYSPIDRMVYIYPIGQQRDNASKLFFLIHELTHALQHKKQGLLNYYLADNVALEREADTQAAIAIKCPSCMQKIVDEELLAERSASNEENEKRAQSGYLTTRDLKFYMQQKSKHDLCDLHKTPITYTQQLRAWLAKTILSKNYDPGTIFDRLSSVQF